jgi:outer membrane protein assembly factor BamA
MHLRLARSALVGWLLACVSLAPAQEQVPSNTRGPLGSCASVSVHEEPPSGPGISITNVTFSGFIQMPVSDQEEIANSIKQQSYAYPLDGMVEEVLERVKAGWQNHGYFKVEVNGDAKTLATSAPSIQIALFVHVEEGAQYHLGGITFRNNKMLSNATILRDEFPIKDGEIFSRQKITEGLENLRRVYGEYGYINYTGVPSTTFNDEKRRAYLEIDVDEGKQFIVSRINVGGIGGLPLHQAMKEFAIRPGDVYNSRLWELSLRRVASLFPDCTCRSDQQKQLDERTGTVALKMNFRSCLSN